MASPATLTSLLLTSKRALHDAQELSLLATEASDNVSRRAVLLSGQRVSWEWNVRAGTIKSNVLREIASRMKEDNSALERELEAVHADRLEMLRSLSQTLAMLSSTLVPASIHQIHRAYSASSSTLFGPDVDAKPVRPSGDDAPEDSKTLRSFVDEESIAALLDGLDEEQAQIGALLDQLVELPASFVDMITKDQAQLPSDLSVHDALVSRDRILDAMDEEMEGIGRHFKQIGEAARLGDEALEPGEFEVLSEDTGHLPEIVDELRNLIGSLHLILYALPESLAFPPLPQYPDPLPVLNRHSALHREIHAHLAILSDKLATIGVLEDSFVAYAQGYEALLGELDRRQTERLKREEILRSWQETLQAWEEDEGHQRAEFMTRYSSVLPADLCPALNDSLPNWAITPL